MAARKTKTAKTAPTREQLAVQHGRGPDSISLTSQLSEEASYRKFNIWLIGQTPLIVHAWSQKAKLSLIKKHTKAVKGEGRETRDPEKEFLDSLYEMEDGSGYGFPAMGVKNAILDSAHKDKGIARSAVLRALWIDADIVSVRTALAKAVCDMPLLRIYGSEPQMREDMVRIGKGLQKQSNLAYRAQFKHWALYMTGRYDEAELNDEQLLFLTRSGGRGSGIGDWRNEKRGIFGAFRPATPEEHDKWENYRNGKGPLPITGGIRKPKLVKAA